MPSHDDCSLCDSEGWYYFQNDGKAYRDNSKKKKINGKYYYFNEHGQMLYEWINTKEYTATGSSTEFILDGNRAGASASDMIYANEVEDGSSPLVKCTKIKQRRKSTVSSTCSMSMVRCCMSGSTTRKYL